MIPNVPIFADKGKLGAVKVYTRGEANKEQIPKLRWDQLRVGMFCMDPKSLGDYQKFVQTACLNDKNCVDGVRRVIDELDNANGSPKTDWPPIREATPEEIERAKRQYETGHALVGRKL